MTYDKKILITIPQNLNKKIDLYLIKIRNMGAKITKAELILNMTEIGLKQKNNDEI